MLDNVKSKYIINEIFETIKNKRKLNIIKYNKRIKFRLSINKEHFDNYIKLNEFNNKYNTNIEDINNKELNLENKRIGNEGLKSLFKIEFKELKELNLSYNEISDINILEKVKFKELKVLNLINNKISDIKVLENVNFKKLEKLKLNYNKISDIKILENVDFKELNKLDLRSNEISDIKVLENVNFKELKELDLSFNNIDNNSIIIKNLKSKIKNILIEL